MPDYSKGPYANWDPKKDPFIQRHARTAPENLGPIDPNSLVSLLGGIPEAALTIGTTVASMPEAGLTGLLVAGTDEENRPMGFRDKDGVWQPSLFGNEPMMAADAVENVMDRRTFMPRSDAGMNTLQQTGSLMETLFSPVTKSTDWMLREGTDAGFSPESMALPLTMATVGAEMIPTNRAGSAGRAAAKRARTLRMPGIMDNLRDFSDEIPSAAFGGLADDPAVLARYRATQPGMTPSATLRSTLDKLSQYDSTMNAHFMRAIDGEMPADVDVRPSGLLGGDDPLPPVAIADRMQPIANRVEAEKRWSDGEDIYAITEMDELPIKIADREMLNAYQPDQLGSMGKGQTPIGQTAAGSRQRGSVEDTGGGKKIGETLLSREALLETAETAADASPTPEQQIEAAALEGTVLPPKQDRLTAKERKKVEALAERYPGIRPMLPNLTVNERRHLNKYRAETMQEVWAELDPSEMASVALAGTAKRGWYERSGKAIIELFGEEDAPRFSALLAAMSPQTSVESNLTNALRTWNEWDKAGRPTDPDKILEVMGRSVEGDRGMDSVLGAWQNNSIRALGSSGDELANIMLSGPKVDSFMRNIWGNFAEVTNDTWIMKYAGLENMFKDHPKVGTINKKTGKPFTALDVAKEKLGGGINVNSTDPGKNGMYLGISAATRKAADLLTKRTGEKWTPAEVQETVWSWTMAMYEKADADVMPVQNLIDRLTHNDVNQTPDFATLLSQPGEYRSIIETGNFNDGIQRLDEFAARGRGATIDPAGAVNETSGIQPRHLTSAAERLESGRRKARKPKVLEDLRASVDRSVAGGQPGPYGSRAAPDRSRNIEATHELSDPKRSQLMNSLGMSTPPVQELKPNVQTATKFRNAIVKAKESNAFGAQVSAKEVDDYKNLRLFLTEDGKAGFAINPEDGDIVSLFNAGNSNHEGVSTHLVMLAIANGGRKLDNYDTFLSTIYKRLGFEEKARFPWDEAEKPSDWNYDTFKKFNDGKPDYLFMEYSPSGKDAKAPGLLSNQSE